MCDAMISQIDLFPTLRDFLQISHPQWLEGRSFLPVLRGQAQEVNEAVFSEINYHASYDPSAPHAQNDGSISEVSGAMDIRFFPIATTGPAKLSG